MSGGEEEEIARLNYIIDEMCKGYTRCADCPAYGHCEERPKYSFPQDNKTTPSRSSSAIVRGRLLNMD